MSTSEERGRPAPRGEASFITTGLRRRGYPLARFALLCGAALLLSCEEPQPPPPSGSSNAPAEAQDPLAIVSKKKRPQPSLRNLGEKGRRVKLIVLPGDASVEIDGFAALRRNGVVELAGRVGDVRRLRVFKGTEQLEQDVTIEETAASPAVLDLSVQPSKQGGGDSGGAAPVKLVDPLFSEEFE